MNELDYYKKRERVHSVATRKLLERGVVLTKIGWIAPIGALVSERINDPVHAWWALTGEKLMELDQELITG